MKSLFSMKSILLACVIVLAGCATIVGGGSTQLLNFDSNPKDVAIFMGKKGKDNTIIDLVDTGKRTPASFEVKRKNVVIVLKKEGYKDFQVEMTRRQNGWFWGNILIGGLLGSSIDSSTGAMHEYDPDHFFVEMKKDGE